MDSELIELTAWGEQHGVYLNPVFEIYRDNTTGLSFRAASDVLGSGESSTRIVTCPYELSLSYLNALGAAPFSRYGSAPFPPRFLEPLSRTSPHVIGNFFLMQQYLLKEESFWWPYIRTLPQPEQPERLGTPVWWSDEDRKFLQGTNAEPAVTERQRLLKEDWKRGMSYLDDVGGSSETVVWKTDYHYNLYQWAATLFGTRSFRTSLSLPVGYRQHQHVREDNFSLLLPVLDIGNHNGINNTEWLLDPRLGMTLATRKVIAQGEQVYNFYGDKSNSELLVGYGFTLPKNLASRFDNDAVNLKFIGTPTGLALYRSLSSYIPPTAALEEFMFKVRIPVEPFAREECFASFSDGLINALICEKANRRQRRFLNQYPKYCPERDPRIFQNLFGSAAIQALEIKEKLDVEMKRIKDVVLSDPANPNQRLALDYRNRQIEILESASELFQVRREQILASCTTPTSATQSKCMLRGGSELLSLESAFAWLEFEYPSISKAIIELIAEDQDEEIPIKWVTLIGDWNHTYWVVWLYLVWNICWTAPPRFQDRHPFLFDWLSDMKIAYNSVGEAQREMGEKFGSHHLFAEPDEEETIINMFNGMAEQAPAELDVSGPEIRKYLTAAAFIVKEEAFRVSLKMQDGEVVEQLAIYIYDTLKFPHQG